LTASAARRETHQGDPDASEYGGSGDCGKIDGEVSKIYGEKNVRMNEMQIWRNF
jgi:hypothetical protein